MSPGDKLVRKKKSSDMTDANISELDQGYEVRAPLHIANLKMRKKNEKMKKKNIESKQKDSVLKIKRENRVQDLTL